MSHSGRIAMALGAAAVIAAASVGITNAATSATHTVKACMSKHGALALLSSRGTCPTGFTRIVLNQTGPRGATGKTGATGKRGGTGAQGPGALELDVATTSTTFFSRSFVAVPGGSGLQLEVNCRANTYSDLVIDDPNGSGTGFAVQGSVVTSSGSGDDVQVVVGNASSQTLEGATPFSISTAPGEAATLQTYSGSFTADLFVQRVVGTSTHAFTVRVYGQQSTTSCALRTQTVVS